MSQLIDLIEAKRDDLHKLCQRYGVERLYLFGSAANGGFVEEASDLDFLVEMGEREPTGSYANRYFGLAEDLESLFGRPVDLITKESVRNPYFQREIEATRQLVYGKPREKAAV